MQIIYRTAWNWFKSGKIEGAYQTPSGTVIVPEINHENQKSYGVILYARTSSSQNKDLNELE